VLVLLVVAACTAAVFTVLAAQHLFPRGGPNLDEVAYDAQARALADGHLTLPAATHDPFFRPFLSGFRDDRIVFKYQPVWPALIASSRSALGSTLPLRTLLAAAGVVATYAFAWQLLDRRRIAIIAAAVVAISPFTWIQSATLLGYQLSFVLGLAAAAAIVRAARARTARAAVVAGVLLGFAAFHRPFDALLAALPVLVYAAFELRGGGRLGRQVAWGAAGALPAALLLGAFNTIVMGAPWKLPFGTSGPIDRFGFGWRASFVVPGSGREWQVHYTVGRALGGMWDSLFAFPRFVVATPVLLLLAVIVAVRQRRDPRVWLLIGMIATLIVGYLSWWGVVNAVDYDLPRSLGPFYHYLALGPLAVLGAWGLVQLQWTRATIIGLAVLAIGWTVPATWIVLHDARDAGQARAAEVALTDAPGRRLVLEDPLFPGDPYARIANDAALSGRRLVGIDVPRRRLDAVERFPDRAAYLVRGFRRAGDIIGPVQREQVPLELVDGDQVQVTASLAPPADRAATAYLRIGETTRTAPISDATWEISPDDLSDAVSEIAVGYQMSPDEFVECRYEGRRTSGDGVRMLEPCDGYAGYAFPDGRTAVSREDVSGRVDVSLQPR
jgi:hypothetical protein